MQGRWRKVRLGCGDSLSAGGICTLVSRSMEYENMVPTSRRFARVAALAARSVLLDAWEERVRVPRPRLGKDLTAVGISARPFHHPLAHRMEKIVSLQWKGGVALIVECLVSGINQQCSSREKLLAVQQRICAGECVQVDVQSRV